LETDEEEVERHVDDCMDELKRAVEEFIKGDALSLIRNVRNEFSGIEALE
jgi:hypothetical protein